MIVQDGGKQKVGLYQDYDVFKSILNEGAVYQADGRNCGLKGVWFKDLAAAKTYIQMVRDEEGVHFGWPQEIPVHWKTGPLFQNGEITVGALFHVAGFLEAMLSEV